LPLTSRAAMSVSSESEAQARFIIALTLVHALRRTEHIGPASSQSVSYNVVSDKLTADKFVFGLGAPSIPTLVRPTTLLCLPGD
jgi:hypothetical protein